MRGLWSASARVKDSTESQGTLTNPACWSMLQHKARRIPASNSTTNMRCRLGLVGNESDSRRARFPYQGMNGGISPQHRVHTPLEAYEQFAGEMPAGGVPTLFYRHLMNLAAL